VTRPTSRPPKKIVRNMSTPEMRELWRTAEDNAAEVATWPAWKRAGLNVSQLRDKPRRIPKTKVSVYLPDDILHALEAEAARLERSISWVLTKWWREREGEGAK
jgi:uncharacterized small protein (TIGR04563 family)